MPKFKLYNQYQSVLLPPALADCLPSGHLCFVINDIVDNLDMSAILKTYSANGSPAYNPQLMVKVLFYGHTQGVRSSRKIENRLNEDIAYRFLAANQQPDHGTISLFRKIHLLSLKEIFSQIVILAAGLQMTDSSDISVDGTKLKANASRSNLFDQEGIDKQRKKIDDYFAEADKIDEEEDKLFGKSVGYNIVSGDLADPVKRRETIKKMNEKLKKKQEKLKIAEKNIKDKQDKARTKEEKELKKNSTSNMTDSGANLMKMKDKSYKMAYNAQFTSSNQIILAYDLNNEPTDVASLPEMIEETEKNTGRKVRTVKADAGYFSQGNIEYCEDNQITAYIPDEMKSVEERQARKNEIPKYDRRNFQYDKDNNRFICPEGKALKLDGKRKGSAVIYIGTECENCQEKALCTKGKNRHLQINFTAKETIDKMRAKLNTEDGKRKYLERMSDIEPVIGNIKHNQNFNHFLCRGKPATLIELGLASTAHNLVKIFHWLKKNDKSRKEIQWNTLMRLQAAC
jgi:transposase